MVEYIDKKMIVDMPHSDGHVFFNKDYFVFKARNEDHFSSGLIFYYKDIANITSRGGIKKTAIIEMNDGKKYRFYMYKLATFLQLVNAGREQSQNNDVDIDFTKHNENKNPLSDEDIKKLERLVKLHDNGVLDDERFEFEKSQILNK